MSLQESIGLWRQHRAELAELPDITSQLEHSAKFFSQVPYGTRTIDFYNPETWPTPWEIFQYGEFCKNSISLLIFHTLSIVNNDINIELAIVETDDMFVLPIIDNKYILNLIPGEVVNLYTLDIPLCIKSELDTTQIKKFA